MKTSSFPAFPLITALAGLAVLLPTPGFAQQEATEKPVPAEETKPETTASVSEELEAKLVDTLANVLFQGRWCTVEGSVMGEYKPEEYEIVGVVKTGGDRWAINARIKYGRVNVVAPVPVQVKWAGDTPIIVVDKFAMPGGGVYSARIMIFENTYSGTWSGGEVGGLLHGVIVKKP